VVVDHGNALLDPNNAHCKSAGEDDRGEDEDNQRCSLKHMHNLSNQALAPESSQYRNEDEIASKRDGESVQEVELHHREGGGEHHHECCCCTCNLYGNAICIIYQGKKCMKVKIA
jgi:hypothetical protein